MKSKQNNNKVYVKSRKHVHYKTGIFKKSIFLNYSKKILAMATKFVIHLYYIYIYIYIRKSDVEMHHVKLMEERGDY